MASMALDRLGDLPIALHRIADALDTDVGRVREALDLALAAKREARGAAEVAQRRLAAATDEASSGLAPRLRLVLGLGPGEGDTEDDLVHHVEGLAHAHDSYKERVEELLPERDALAARLRAVRSALGQP